MKIIQSLKPRVFISIIIFLLCNISISIAQDTAEQDKLLREKAIKVFLDMRGSRAEHIKREITFINYVRDRKQAQLYIMETRQSTGARGSEYTIALIGQQEFESINDTIVYISKASDTDEMVRDELVKLLKH